MGLSRRTVLNPLDVLAAIKTVDGAGSGLDADLLDNMHANDILDETLNQMELALADSPALGGAPTAPTAAPGTDNEQIATTEFVQDAVEASVSGVASFNGRTGAVVPQLGDYTAAQVGAVASAEKGIANGIATLDSAGKVPQSQLPASSGVASFNSRTGAVVPQSGDYTAEQVGALPDTTVIPASLSELADDSTHRTVTDTEKTSWNAKAPGYQYSTTDLTAGTSPLATGTLYFVYE